MRRFALLALAVVLAVGGGVAFFGRGLVSAGSGRSGSTTPILRPVRIPMYRGTTTKRVALIGDSTMWGAAPEISAALADHGLRGPVFARAWPSTGVGGPNRHGFDWMSYIDTVLAQDKPDLVVATFIGNFGTPQSTRANAIELIRRCHAAGAQVVWDIPAVIDKPGHAAVNRYYSHIARMFRSLPADAFVDWGRTLSPDGRWLEYARTDRGREQIRRPDGIHLLDPGDRLIADATVKVLARYWR
jgi:hypothetical protein